VGISHLFWQAVSMVNWDKLDGVVSVSASKDVTPIAISVSKSHVKNGNLMHLIYREVSRTHVFTVAECRHKLLQRAKLWLPGEFPAVI
jgi:hypothetical protein